MGRSSSSASKGKRSAPNGASQAGAPGTSSQVFAEARRRSQQASKKSEGPARSSVLKACVDLFRNGLSFPLPVTEREEALFDLGEVLLQLCGSLQARLAHLPGFFDGTVKKPQALEAQLQNALIAAGICRESAETFESVCSMEGQLKQEALVNNGVAYNDWAELALEIPERNGGGVAFAKDLLGRAHQRYSAALQVAPVDVELLMNYADCCVRISELESDYPAPEQGCQWEATLGLYNQGFSAYSTGCSNADARIGDDLAGLLHNWGSGLFSAAERCSALDEAFEFVVRGKEKFSNAIKFRPTDTSIRIGLGECLSGFVDKIAGRASCTQQLDYLRVACEEGYGAALKIDSSNPAALLGLGDAHLAAAKLLTEEALQSQAQKHLAESVKFFHLAFENIKKDLDKLSGFKYEELCDSLYNFACAAALSRREEKAIECVQHLLSLEALSLEDALKDSDLTSLNIYLVSKMTS